MPVMNAPSSSFGEVYSTCSFTISDSYFLEGEWAMEYFMIFLVVFVQLGFRAFLSAFLQFLLTLVLVHSVQKTHWGKFGIRH